MDWLNHREAQALTRTLAQPNAPQTISLFADVANMYTEIPTQPSQIPPEKGPPSSVHRWYGRIGNRLVVIDCEASGIIESPQTVVYTEYLEIQDELGDWAVLLDLQALPKSIHVKRPLFIESRNANPACVVYRTDPQGWKTAIYGAATSREAEDLLAFVRQDKWNESCSIGEPEPPGNWATFQGEEVILGTGSGLNSTLRFACEWSLRYAPTVLTVRDISGLCKDVYTISHGHVL